MTHRRRDQPQTGREAGTEIEKWLRMYRQMVSIRLFEEQVNDLYTRALMPGLAHLYIGEEAVAVGICEALRIDDYITSTHRGHGHCLAKGASPDRMFAELLGKEAGYCRGKGGSMHIADPATGNLGANAIVGGSAGIATGAAFAAKHWERTRRRMLLRRRRAGPGVLYEVMNLAQLWKLPVIYVCENNMYNEYTHYSETTAGDILARATAFGLQAEKRGWPGRARRARSRSAIGGTRAHAATGQRFLLCNTYRYQRPSRGRHQSRILPLQAGRAAMEDGARSHQDLGEVADRTEAMLTLRRSIEITSEVRTEMEAAVEFAIAAPYPERRRSGPGRLCLRRRRELTFAQAVREALAEEMRRDSRVCILGEDVAEAGTPFKVLSGLVEEFGKERVIDTPISEAGFTGIAVGAAMTGLRPVVDIMFGDFITLTMDQMVNQAAKVHYMSGGKWKVPMVMRTTLGATRRSAAQHSQSLHAWFSHVPGLKVVLPSTPYDAKGLLKTAIRDENPVVFFEDKMMYKLKGPVPAEEYTIPLGVADMKRVGDDITLVATSSMVQVALGAAKLLEEGGISAEVIDPRTTWPLDEKTLIDSAKKTSRVIVIDEGYGRYGVTAEIASVIAEGAFYDLDAPVKRMGAMHVPIPFSPPLEDATVPTEQTVFEAARELCRQILRCESSGLARNLRLDKGGASWHLPTHGTMAVDWEQRIDFDRLRRERLARAKELLANRRWARCCAST